MYPVKLTPTFKDYIWGGTRLKEKYNKASNLDIIAESWELSCHKNGESVVANGEFKGYTLSRLIEEWGITAIGSNIESSRNFPILIKLIDSKQPLSIQVHPDDEYAMANAGEFGKTEMWYIVEADEGAKLVYGFNKDMTVTELKKRINNNTLTEVLNYVSVKSGDVFMINAGLVHAIGEGLLIAEIQQNSDTTYRMYDYGRLGADGKPRPLHIEDAVNVSNLNKSELPPMPVAEQFKGYSITKLAKCKYFDVCKYKLWSSLSLNADLSSFNAITVTSGEGEIIFNNTAYPFGTGETYFIPAGMGLYEIKGNAELLLSKI